MVGQHFFVPPFLVFRNITTRRVEFSNEKTQQLIASSGFDHCFTIDEIREEALALRTEQVKA